MDIQLLPMLPFQLVMEEMVACVGLYKAVRLRLVSSKCLGTLDLLARLLKRGFRSVRSRDFTRYIRK